ncbi:hypothetical protein Pelo_18119 [Pelomyxa schiedti]|nr:hypothetical protein Pelo_18119 [Pelomyxa schiedti]
MAANNNTRGIGVDEGVGGGDDVLCWVCMDTYRDPVYLECGHTVCRSCALTTLVAAARLARLPPVAAPAAAAMAATTAPPTTGQATSRAVGTMPGPGQTNAPRPLTSTASSPCGTSSSSSSSSSSTGCQWGCCSPDATGVSPSHAPTANNTHLISLLFGLSKEMSDISEKEAEAISKVNAEQLSVPKVITDGCMSILADLQLIQSAVETRCKEINEMSQSLSDTMSSMTSNY